MEFIQENETLEKLDHNTKIRKKIDLYESTKWNNIAKVVLTKDKRLLEKILLEANPEYRNKLLDQPLVQETPNKKKSEKIVMKIKGK